VILVNAEVNAECRMASGEAEPSMLNPERRVTVGLPTG